MIKIFLASLFMLMRRLVLTLPCTVISQKLANTIHIVGVLRLRLVLYNIWFILINESLAVQSY